jgi:uncharacterized lipoprotein YmbA
MKKFCFLLLMLYPVLVVILGGCVNLKPTADPTRFYVLSAEPAKEPLSHPVTLRLPVWVATVETPAYLDNNCLAVRRNGSQLDYLPYQEWAEPVRNGITRCLREDLAAILGPGTVIPLSYRRPSGDYLEVQAGVSRFEFTGSGQAVLAVRWLITQSRTGAVLHAQTSEFVRDTVDVSAQPGAAVGALSAAVNLWSLQVAGVLTNQAWRLGELGRP